MNNPEERRRELLRQTRKLYDEKKEIPAIHPRYGRIYNDLYKDSAAPETPSGGTFYIRLAVGILCFVCFVYMDQNKTKVAEVDSSAIVTEIEKNMDTDTIKEVWKNL